MKKVKKMAMGGLGKAIKGAAAKSAASKTPTKISSVGVPASERPVNPNFVPRNIAIAKVQPDGSTRIIQQARTIPIDSVGGRQVNLSPTPQPALTRAPARPSVMSRLGSSISKQPVSTQAPARAVSPSIEPSFEFTSPPEVAKMKKGGKVKTASASKRADGIAQRGKTRGKII